LPALNLKAEQALNFITIDSKNYGVSNFDFSGFNFKFKYYLHEFRTVTKVPNGKSNYRCGYWFYYCFTIRNDYYLAAREAKRSFTINKAVLIKPDDRDNTKDKSNT
jgi:hypothetical protein